MCQRFPNLNYLRVLHPLVARSHLLSKGLTLLVVPSREGANEVRDYDFRLLHQVDEGRVASHYHKS